MLANVSRRVVATAIPRPAIRDQFALTSSTGSTIVARHRIKFHKLPADYRRRTGRRDMQEGYIPTAMQYLRSLEPDYLPDSGPQKRVCIQTILRVLKITKKYFEDLVACCRKANEVGSKHVFCSDLFGLLGVIAFKM
jgi:hypothetical protein